MCIHPKKKCNLHVPVFNENGNTIYIIRDDKYLRFNLLDAMTHDINIHRQITGATW